MNECMSSGQLNESGFPSRMSPNAVRGTFGIFLFLLLSPIISPKQLRADPADDTYQLAAGYYKLGRWELASDGFRKFIVGYPQNPRVSTARFFLALSLVNRNQFKEARDSLLKFVVEAPQSRNIAHAYYRIGECSYLLDDFVVAEKELTDYINRFPGDVLNERALPYLADVQLRLNKVDLAAKSFQLALEKFPNGPLVEDCGFGLAKCHEATKSLDQAIAVYTRLAANTKSRRAPEAQLSLGNRLFEQKKYAEALAAFQKLEASYPSSSLVSTARLNQGACLFEKGEFAEALERFKSAEADPQQVIEATYWRGRSLSELGQHQESQEVLKKLYEQHRDAPQSVRILYYLGLEEQHLKQLSDAQKHFLELAARFPKSEQADDALHLAGLAALDLGDTETATKLAGQFEQNYPTSPLRWAQDLLRGRILLMSRQYAMATPFFDRVLNSDATTLDRQWARYYLGFAQLELRNPAEVLVVTETLVPLVTADPKSPLVPVLLLRGAAQLALGNNEAVANTQREFYAAVIDSASRYLAAAPQGKDVDQALALRALAGAHSGLKDRAKSDVEELQKSFSKSPETDKTIYEVAEVAYSNQDWVWSEELFRILATRDPGSKYKQLGASGRAWSLFQNKQFDEAAQQFALVAKDFPDHKDTPEAAFMHGKATQNGSKPFDAISIFEGVFQKYSTSRFAYLAGLEAARLYRDAQKYLESDKAYALLLERFPKPDHYDKVLNEWASSNYEGQNFARSDEIYAKLIKETPDSELADNARLSLAESELLAGKVDVARDAFVALEKDVKSDLLVQEAALFQLLGIATVKSDWMGMATIAESLSSRFPMGKHFWFSEMKRGEAALNLGEIDRATQLLQKVIDQRNSPEVANQDWFGDAWVLLAESQHRNKLHDEVQKTVADCRAWNSELPVLYALDEISGRSFKAQAKFPEAIAQFQRVTEDKFGRRTETAAKSQFLIGDILLLQKNFTKAEEEFLKVEILYKFPAWQAPALFQAGCCQEELMNWSTASRHFNSVIKSYPKSEFAKMAAEHLVRVQSKLNPSSSGS